MLSGFSEHSPRRCLCVFSVFKNHHIPPYPGARRGGVGLCRVRSHTQSDTERKARGPTGREERTPTSNGERTFIEQRKHLWDIRTTGHNTHSRQKVHSLRLVLAHGAPGTRAHWGWTGRVHHRPHCQVAATCSVRTLSCLSHAPTPLPPRSAPMSPPSPMLLPHASHGLCRSTACHLATFCKTL